MAETRVGTVTRVAHAGPSNSNYLARGANGIELGYYQNAADAQQAVAQLSTGRSVLRWVRNDMASIEHYEGYRTDFP